MYFELLLSFFINGGRVDLLIMNHLYDNICIIINTISIVTEYLSMVEMPVKHVFST